MLVILAPFGGHSQSTQPPLGDVIQFGTGTSEDVPERAFKKLYQAAAEITADPSSGYRPPRGMVEVVVSVPPAQHREVLSGLEDPRDGDTGLRGVVDGGGRGAPGEALQV